MGSVVAPELFNGIEINDILQWHVGMKFMSEIKTDKFKKIKCAKSLLSYLIFSMCVDYYSYNLVPKLLLIKALTHLKY